MSAELDGIVSRLAALLGMTDVDPTDQHGRWAVYDQAMRRGMGAESLLAAAPHEADTALVCSIVLRMLEAAPVDAHRTWIELLPEDERALSRRRSSEIRTMRDLASRPRLPARTELESWSDWLQLRLAESSGHQELLRLLSEHARTRRTRNTAQGRLTSPGGR